MKKTASTLTTGPNKPNAPLDWVLGSAGQCWAVLGLGAGHCLPASAINFFLGFMSAIFSDSSCLDLALLFLHFCSSSSFCQFQQNRGKVACKKPC
jgi:hypothetical protein